MCCLFFFQAEDGIRDDLVTGVQTCALPISTDVTPKDPMQRGCIWMHGGADICRNLLDFFDMTVDKQGRVQVGYVDGCADGACAQAALTAKGNAYTATRVIARPSSGRRLIARFSPPHPLTAKSPPAIPSVSVRR